MSGYEEIELVNPCSMCEEEEATVTWGVPVCQDCADWLTELNGTLNKMEAADPALREVGDRIRDTERTFNIDGDGPPDTPITY